VPNPELIFQSGLTFFGLTPERVNDHRVDLFTQIHEIVFWGNGGYSWGDIYNMPIWLRKFTFSKLSKYYSDKAKQSNTDPKKQTLVDSTGNINKEAFKEAAPKIKHPQYK
jgi:hypothetical protein